MKDGFPTNVQVPTVLATLRCNRIRNDQSGISSHCLLIRLMVSQDMAKVHLSNSALTSFAGDDYSCILLEQIATMVKKEDAFYSCVDYIGELPQLDNDSIDGEWRQMAAEWMFRVIDFYDLDREIVSQS